MNEASQESTTPDTRRRLNEWWRSRTGGEQVSYVAGTVAVIIVLAMVLSAVFDPPKPRDPRVQQQSAEPRIETKILGNSRTRDVNLENLAAEQKSLQERFEKLERTSLSTQRSMEETLKEMRELVNGSDLRQWKAEQQRALEELSAQVASAQLDQSASPTAPYPAPHPQTDPTEDLFADAVVGGARRIPPSARAADAEPAPRSAPPPRQLRIYGAAPAPTGSDTDDTNSPTNPEATGPKRREMTQPNPTVVLPAGSILEGGLLTGVDALTTTSAQQNPHPVLIRLKEDSIGPNGYSVDLKECAIIGAGYGDLSSERVMIRASRLSCFSEAAGTDIYLDLDAYAVGEDGSLGLRGPLVERSGALIAKSLKAGLLSGFGQAFAGSSTRGLVVTDNNAVNNVNYSEIARVGAASGVANAMDRLAQRFLDQADQIYPVITLQAGRVVTLVTKAPLTIEVGPS